MVKTIKFQRTAEIYAECPKCSSNIQFYNGMNHFEVGSEVSCISCKSKFKISEIQD